MVNRKSDYSIVLRGRESRLHDRGIAIYQYRGEGNSSYTQRSKETSPGNADRIRMQTSLSGIDTTFLSLGMFTKTSITEEPGAVAPGVRKDVASLKI